MTRQKLGEQKDGIIKRGKFWSYRVRVPDPITGKTKEVRISGFSSKEEARISRDRSRTDKNQGVFISPSRMTVKDHFEEWFSIKSYEIKPTTVAQYRQILDYYILPRLGSITLKDLSADKIEKFYIDLIQGGKKNGSPLSEATVRLVSMVLSQGLEKAVKGRKIAFNPANHIKKPKGKTKVITTYTVPEVKSLLQTLEDHRLYAFFHLSASTGARRGELCALRWSDFDSEKGEIAISKNRSVAGNEVIEQDSTKSKNGRREVSIDPETVRVLKAHRIRQTHERLRLGQAWQETGYIFVQEDGKPIHPQTPYQLFKSTARKIGLRSEPFHILRHFHATVLLRQGVPAYVVADRLGDEVQTVLKTYAHIQPDQKQEVANHYLSAIENG